MLLLPTMHTTPDSNDFVLVPVPTRSHFDRSFGLNHPHYCGSMYVCAHELTRSSLPSFVSTACCGFFSSNRTIRCESFAMAGQYRRIGRSTAVCIAEIHSCLAFETQRRYFHLRCKTDKVYAIPTRLDNRRSTVRFIPAFVPTDVGTVLRFQARIHHTSNK